MDNSDIILERYLRLASSSIKPCISKKNHINFRCNICGDSKNKTKMRGHLRFTRDKSTFKEFWYYKCFNEGDCPASGEGEAWSAEIWLKKTSPHFYRQYISEILSNKKPKKVEIPKIEITRPNRKLINKEEKENVSHFVPLIKPTEKAKELIDLAITLCEKRNIPKDVYKKWFVSTGGTYRNRMIIPFYNDKNKIYFYQARTLKDQDPKYINKKSSLDVGIYNYYNVDKSKPVMVIEGPIDSLFLENSIAVLGLTFSEEKIKMLSKLTPYYLLDNDGPGKKKSLKLLKQGNYVFLWDKWNLGQNCKDINNVILKHNISKFTFEDLKPYFSNNYYDEIYLR